MRIAVDARGAVWYAGTGIGTYTAQILKYMLKYDDENSYHLYWWGMDYKKLYRDNVSLSIASKKHHRFFEDYFIPQNLSSKSIDVYHVPQNGMGLPSSKKCIYISTVHDLIPYIMPETVGKGYLKKFISSMPNIIQNSDYIITVSEFSKKDIMRIFDVPEEKIKVTHLAADEYFHPIKSEEAKKFLYENYRICDNYILYIGGFSPRKNVRSLLVAYSSLPNDLKEKYKIVIIGASKDDHSTLISLCDGLNIKDNVIFTGFVPYEHLPYFYNSSRVFVYPSLYEGFGLPPLEAMSCRVPVITSNISSIPEVVSDGAILINPFDTQELKTSLENILEDDNACSQIAKRGYEISKNYTWSKTAAKTLSIYEEAYAQYK